MAALVTLLTDFGTHDWFVAAMKARILAAAPRTRFVDVTHEVPPQAVDAAGFALACVWREFGEGTIHLVVVDPGVGTDRRAVVVKTQGHVFVGPDNGVFARALEGQQPSVIVELDPSRWGGTRRISATFHGRDVFAPAVAQLALGRPAEDLGHRVLSLLPGRTRSWRAREFAIEAPVVWIDRFGNCITDVPADRLPPRPRILAGSFAAFELVHSYADVPARTPAVLVGSNGTLEIVVTQGRADRQLGLAVGDIVRIESSDGGPW